VFRSTTAYRKIYKGYSKNLPEYLAFRYKHYPEFVYDQRPKPIKNEIPVFTLHSVEPGRFEEQLEYLTRNGYQTVDADQLYEFITGIKPVPERTIVLTFDDGWRNLWEVVYPLLKKYRYKAVSFIIPGLIKETKAYYPNLEDCWEGKAKPDAIGKPDKSIDPLCTWQEIKTMHESKTIDFQSHTMYHSLIFTSPEIEDFVHPSFDFYKMNFNVPIFLDNNIENISREAELGMPIYVNAPRFSGMKRYYDDVGVRKSCIEYVEHNGGSGFFKKPFWRKTLKDAVSEYRKKHGTTGYFEGEQEQEENLYTDLLGSKKTIEGKLPRKIVSHLGYPWWVGSDLSIAISKKAGYRTNFWGVIEERRTTNRAGDDPYRIGRLLGDECIFRLPGEGRKPLRKIMEDKFMIYYKGFMRGFVSPNKEYIV
jgi:peptidoglycan/xylan/chitin deacetylase (PgdA/CDA1 family)